MKVTGIVAATFAAYGNDGSLNLSIIPKLVDKLISEGVSGIYVCGTNGEGLNLTVEERMAVAEAYVKAANKRILIFVHVGHTSITECKKLAAHAAAIGADAFSAIAAFYFKPVSVQNLVSCMAEIASAAPDLPFYYYHMPAMTGVTMDMVEFLTLAEKAIPNLAGIKYSSSELYELQACLNSNKGKFEILSGYDEMLLSALVVGATGAIGSTYTFAAPVYLEIIKLFQANDLTPARQLQLKAVDFIRCFEKYPSVAAQRAIMKMLGFDMGNPRLPLISLSEQEFKSLKTELEEMGFFALLQGYNSIY